MSLSYLASPYTKYAAGLDAAWRDISRIGAKLLVAGVHTYSPIAHCHSLAMNGDLDPLDVLNLWYPHNAKMMEVCSSLIVAQLPGWQESQGVRSEVETFDRVGKPIYDLMPETMTMIRRRGGGDGLRRSA